MELSEEEVIDGEVFIDGISQKEEITDFDLDGVEVFDGRLAFKDHESLMSAIEIFSQHNTESILAWGEKHNFVSLFSELIRLENLPSTELEATLNEEDMYADYFTVSPEGILGFSHHVMPTSMIFNPQSLVQVGEFVGAFYTGLNVWVSEENTKHLVNALKNSDIPNDNNIFMVGDKSVFESENKIWTQDEDCPKTAPWSPPGVIEKSPAANRHLYNEIYFWKVPTITGSVLGNRRYKITYHITIYTESRKGIRNLYKTNHYYSIDAVIGGVSQWSSGGFGIPTETHSLTRQINNTTVAGSRQKVGEVTNVGFGIDYFTIESLKPGTSGFEGTAGSHRGMGGRYIRIDCD